MSKAKKTVTAGLTEAIYQLGQVQTKLAARLIYFTTAEDRECVTRWIATARMDLENARLILMGEAHAPKCPPNYRDGDTESRG